MKVSAVVVSHGHADELARVASGAAPAGGRDRRRGEPPRIGSRRTRRRPRSREPAPALARGERQPRHRRDERRVRAQRQPGRDRRAGCRGDARRLRRRASALRDRGTADALARRQLAAVPPAVPDRSWDDRASDAAPPACALRTRRSASTTPSTSAPTEPVEADWMLGAFLLMRRTMLDEIGGWDAGFRHYCEDIDLCYRAAHAGWERWYVPGAVVTHAYAAVIDQQLPLSPHALARARHGPLRPQASGAPARAVSSKEDQYARQAADWTERAYADVGAYLDHRAELIVALGPRLEPGDEVLDLACGDGGLGEALLARGVGYRGVDVDGGDGGGGAAPARRARARSSRATSTTYTPPAPVAATTVFRAIYYARDRVAFFAHARRATRRRSSSSTSTRGSTASRTSSLTSARRASVRSSSDRSSSRRPSRCPAPFLRSRRRSSEAARSHAPRSARASPISSQPRASRRTAAGTRPGR